jgi:hypothetical protein
MGRPEAGSRTGGSVGSAQTGTAGRRTVAATAAANVESYRWFKRR